MKRQTRAYAWRSGQIEVSDGRTPPGAIKLFTFRSPRAALVGRRILETRARHAYNGRTLIVPGVPEAADDDGALDALLAWCKWVHPEMQRRLPRRMFQSEVPL